MENRSTVHTPEGTLEKVTEIHEFETLAPMADKKWTYTDRRGHGHFWFNGGYPTLTWVKDEEDYWCEDCRDMHEGGGHWECRRCGEKIEPRKIPGPHRLRAEGLTEWLWNGEPITKDEFDARWARLQEQYGQEMGLRD